MYYPRPKLYHYVIEVSRDKDFKNETILELQAKIKVFVKETKLNIIKSMEHEFTPQGYTAVFILSSSHLAVHTWPENNYIHFDLLSCTKIKKFDLLKGTKSIFSGKIRIKKI